MTALIKIGPAAATAIMRASPWNTPEMTNSTVLLATFFGRKRIGTFDRLGSAKYNQNNAAQSFYPYGEDRGTMQPNDSLKFATYTRDAATGLDYADQRYYASNFGRMMSPDPYEASIGSEDPGSWNRYSYTRADPINRLDPAGLSDTCPDCIASVTAYSFQDTVGSGSGAPLGTNWAWVAMNFADTKGQPPLPILEGANQKQNSAFQKAVALALKLLQKKDGKCASFFGGLQNAIDELVGANYQFDITNALAAAGSGAAAQTDSADNSVTISTLGPFFAQYQTVNGSTSNYGASLGLNGTNFQAFILLHELGHLTGAYGSTDNDATNTANQIANNTAVLKDCFNKDFKNP